MSRWRVRGLLSPLDRKLLRDLWSMKGQAAAVAFVIAGGVAVYLVMAGLLTSLEETRRAYYERYRFADVRAPVVRAPNTLIDGIRRIEGVQAAEVRVRVPALFDMPDMTEPATGEVFSLPDYGSPTVNQIHLTRGRLPHPGLRGEAVVLQGFAEAHHLAIGDTLPTTIYGGREDVRIVGIALSPEHVYAIAPGQLVPDARLFGVLWMGREALAQAVNQQGAFNEAVVRLRRGANAASAVAALDALLEPYGAAGAYTREDEISNAFVSSEIDNLGTMRKVLPPIFLVVAAFLVNVVISRLIATERTEIGLMKAFGYKDGDVAVHYLKLVSAIAILGLVIGIALGSWLGRMLATLYTEFYSFPLFVFRADPRVYALVVVVAVAATVGGAAAAVRRAARLEPATAMLPPSPPDYSRAAGTAATGLAWLDHQTRMVLRQIVRFPSRAAFTTAGIAASGALLIGTLFFTDAIQEMIRVYFDVANRYDVQVTFTEARSTSAGFELLRAPGVLSGEPYRSVMARLKSGSYEERASLSGYPLGARLSRMIDTEGKTVTPPPGGLVLSRDLADKLRVNAGDLLEVEVTEGRRPTLVIPITSVTTTLIGSAARMLLQDLNAVLHEGEVISGVDLIANPDAVDALYAELKRRPGVASVGLQRVAQRTFTNLMDRNIGVMVWVYSGFAGLIAIGVVYNTVRISFAERERELASLRVLGFTRGEVSYILLGEIAFLTLAALPLGAALGTGLARALSHAMSSDLFRVPFVIHPGTYGRAGVVILVVTGVSALLVRRQLDRMDLVGVLKSRE
ncbi:MAG TPA: FtsX-like permease family protein [Woeseiaceae bacterium]|nr:FtsX-like permease family protein [Woeseiaceae bacterium]